VPFCGIIIIFFLILCLHFKEPSCRKLVEGSSSKALVICCRGPNTLMLPRVSSCAEGGCNYCSLASIHKSHCIACVHDVSFSHINRLGFKAEYLCNTTEIVRSFVRSFVCSLRAGVQPTLDLSVETI